MNLSLASRVLYISINAQLPAQVNGSWEENDRGNRNNLQKHTSALSRLANITSSMILYRAKRAGAVRGL